MTGRHGRGLIPRISCWRISLATVLRETTSPASRRSARIRGDPLTPSEASWATLIFSSGPPAAAARGPGPPSRRPPRRSSPTGTPPAARPSATTLWVAFSASITANARSGSSLRGEEGRRFFQELPVHPQLGVLTAQPLQLGPLVDVQRLAADHPSVTARSPPTGPAAAPRPRSPGRPQRSCARCRSPDAPPPAGTSGCNSSSWHP